MELPIPLFYPTRAVVTTVLVTRTRTVVVQVLLIYSPTHLSSLLDLPSLLAGLLEDVELNHRMAEL